MPQASAPGRSEAGGSTPTTMRRSGGAARTRAASIIARVQSAVGAVLDDLAIDFLAAEARAGVARQHLLEKGRRQMRGVGPRGRARHRGARIGEQPLDQRDRPRRGGDELARTLPQPQAELQHVEGRVDIVPLGELVAPGGVELRAAQLLGILRGKRISRRRRSATPGAGATATQTGRSLRGDTRRSPAGPSIITSRTSCSVSPTSAMCIAR